MENSPQDHHHSLPPTPGVVHNYSLNLPYQQQGTTLTTATQDALLREQELATQNIIRTQREMAAMASPSTSTNFDNSDIFSQRHHPNALKEHLLNMATHHRAQIAVKRPNPTHPQQQGNTEIGNGYGVPGGGAYNDVPKLNADDAGNNASGQPESKLDGCSEQKPAAKELPEYLKQKLQARGILKDDRHTEDPKATSAEFMGNEKLPPGWVEAKDPGSGAFYYYNESTGKSQWEKPGEASLTEQSTTVLCLPDSWVEALDETTENQEYG